MKNPSSILTNGVSIIIPVFEAVEKLILCLDSLAEHLPPDCSVYVIDDASIENDIEFTVTSRAARFERISYQRNPTNVGFVKTCNLGIASLSSRTDDVLLLNSDTEVTEGFLEEMSYVLGSHDRHAAVCPRSNNATIFSLPVHDRFTPECSYAVWQAVRNLLSRFHTAPTAVGFCVLIKRAIIDNFGLFDEVYSPGYNEENDFVCRINQYGYSAVSANQAFVFHHSSSSFGERKEGLEELNRQTLISRYPEYDQKIADYLRSYIDPIEHFAPLFLPHRPRMLFDLSHLPARHAGTSEFALTLLAHVAPMIEQEWDLYVTISDEANSFFNNEIAGYRFYDEKREPLYQFDLVFKPCQLFSWQELYRMARAGTRVCFTLLDIIAVRCDRLTAASRYFIFKSSVELADAVFTLSEFSRRDFDDYFGFDSGMKPIHLGGSPEMVTKRPSGGYVLVVGNSFRHKSVGDAVKELTGVGDIVAIGGNGGFERPGVRFMESGGLSRGKMRSLYANAELVVFPSHYEGFGLPIVEALNYGKPVVALDTDINRELIRLYPSGIHLVQSFTAMRDAVRELLRQEPRKTLPVRCHRTWHDVGAEYFEAFQKLIATPVDCDLLRKRWSQIRLLQSVVDLT